MFANRDVVGLLPSDPDHENEIIPPEMIKEVYASSDRLGMPVLKSGKWVFGPTVAKGVFNPKNNQVTITGTLSADQVFFYALLTDGTIRKVDATALNWKYASTVSLAANTLFVIEDGSKDGALQYGEFKTPELVADGQAHQIRVNFNCEKPIGTYLDAYGITFEMIREFVWIAPYTVKVGANYSTCTVKAKPQRDAKGNIFVIFDKDINGNPIREMGIGSISFSFVNPKINRGALTYGLINPYKFRLQGSNFGGVVYYTSVNTLMMDLTGTIDLNKFKGPYSYQGE